MKPSDAGRYYCKAQNDKSGVAAMAQTDVNVQCKRLLIYDSCIMEKHILLGAGPRHAPRKILNFRSPERPFPLI